MEFTSPEAEQRYAALVRESADAIVGLDFDGTLSPIVADPAEAHIHPGAPEVLVDLSAQVRAVAVITGRPARQALALGGLDVVGDAIGEQGRELFVYGQYGNERWSSTDRRVISPRPPHGVASFLRDVPGVVRRAGFGEAYIEEKGLAVAVHTRRLDDPDAAYERLLPLVSDLAHHYDLMVEPGRNVIEVRAPGMDKGEAVFKLATDLAARGFMFAGDDLGDIEAFKAVVQLRASGLATLLVCSDSAEQSALKDLADVVVAGPVGVLELLAQFTVDAASIRA
ncbi:Trehalose 6-phosphatase [metagenome]|uniref:Trehalose 6-phosphatase n=1 Tax=metagenome TaxID=256318 RepID=A0A2P2C0P9_9ZZZZ